MVINLPKKLIIVIAFLSVANLDIFRYESTATSLEPPNQISLDNNLKFNPLLASRSSQANGVELTVNSSNDNINLVVTGIGKSANFYPKENKSIINIEIITGTNKKLLRQEQSLSLPSAGIKVVTLTGSDKIFNLNIISSEGNQLTDVKYLRSGNDLIVQIPKGNIVTPKLTEDNIFKLKPISKAPLPTVQPRAVAPPLGDIAIGTTIIPNPNLIDLEGPNVSLIFKQTQTKKAIEYLMSKVDYGFVWVQQDPAYNPDSGTAASAIPGSLDPMSSAIPGAGLLSPIAGSQSGGGETQTNADSHRLITLTLKDIPFSDAFKAVLMASGLQARLENGIVYVGPNVRESVFSTRVSRVYRLNQTTANAAASYLANLGARVTRTSTLTTAVTQGATQSQAVAGGASASTTTSGSSTSVQVYGSDIGPLLGLVATTDDRLQTVTMIGSSQLINVAESYLKQLDLRQRQVALTVRILDVNLQDQNQLQNSWSFRQNNNFIVNDNGKLLASFGRYLPANESKFTTPSQRTVGEEAERRTRDTSNTPAEVDTAVFPGAFNQTGQTLDVNPAQGYPDKDFFDFLQAQLVSSNTKIIASPTLILNEYAGQSGGEAVAFNSISQSLTAGTIGRSYGNEGFVIVGTQVPVNCSSSGDSEVASFEYGVSGLTFGARILRIDDNGFVTFSISPSVSAPADTRVLPCGTIDLLSTRRLDSGSIRVRDGHTLILTGVINSYDTEAVTKFPIFGDLPLIGQFFRNRTGSKEQRELVILVTPQILNGSDMTTSDDDFDYSPMSKDAQELMRGFK